MENVALLAIYQSVHENGLGSLSGSYCGLGRLVPSENPAQECSEICSAHAVCFSNVCVNLGCGWVCICHDLLRVMLTYTSDIAAMQHGD